MSGSVIIAGLGPGADDLITPEVTAALAEATDVVGYTPYLARIRERPASRCIHPVIAWNWSVPAMRWKWQARGGA